MKNNDLNSALSVLNHYDLMNFIPNVTRGYIAPWHFLPIVRLLNRISFFNDSYRILLHSPPRHGKTELLIHFIAQYLLMNQDKTVAYASYAQRFSESKTQKVIEKLKELNIPLNTKMQNRDEFRLQKGGGLLTTSISGTLTGYGTDLLILDDPVKNYEEATSHVYRERNWNWFENTMEVRLEPGASAIIVMTRWHEDDLAGRIIKNRSDFINIRIPALEDNLTADGKRELTPKEKKNIPSACSREHGEALWPGRYGKETLEKMREYKPNTFMAQYQGLPQPLGGRPFSNVAFYNKLPDKLIYAIGCDLAYTDKTTSDYSTYVVLAKNTDNNNIYLIDTNRWQTNIGQTIDRLKALQMKYPGTKIAIESNGPQVAICDMLRNAGLSLKRHNPINDKFARAQELIEDWQQGRIMLPDPNIFPEKINKVQNYLEIMQGYTGINDRHDDEVDATVWAHKELTNTNTWFIM